MNPNFYTQKARGKRVENIVKKHLESRGHKVIDVSENANFQKIDTDFIVSDKTGTNSISLEIKRDDSISKTGNFFFEMSSEDNYGRVVNGWVKYTHADYLCFYDTKVNKGYILAWTALKSVLSTLGRIDFFYDYQDQKLTEARLVPIGKLKKNGFVVYEWEE